MDRNNHKGSPHGLDGNEERSRLAILICTMDRPEALRRCLASISSGTAQPLEVIVSDDSLDGTPNAAVCAEFPKVLYMKGPRRGLCANRNEVIRRSSAQFVSLLDDDALVSHEFVRQANEITACLPTRVLVSGSVAETERLLAPSNPTFLGFFGKPPSRRLENINLNCNLFPRMAFADASFDEAILYGYEDMDLCARLVSLGYQIRYEPHLVNIHLPPKRSAELEKNRFIMTERFRFYTSAKRYLLWERSWWKLVAYTLIAPVHRASHAVKTGKWFDLPYCFSDMFFALRSAAKAGSAYTPTFGAGGGNNSALG